MLVLTCGKPLHDSIISQRGKVLAHKTSITLPLSWKCLYQARKVSHVSTVPLSMILGIVPTVWYFRIVPTEWYFRIVPTVWYFRIVPIEWYFLFFTLFLYIVYYYQDLENL